MGTLLAGQLSSRDAQVESVDCRLALGIDQRDLDVAAALGNDGGNAMQQARTILRHNLKDGAVARRIAVEVDVGFNLHLGRLAAAGGALAGKFLQGNHAIQNVVEARLEALPLLQVHLQGVEVGR